MEAEAEIYAVEDTHTSQLQVFVRAELVLTCSWTQKKLNGFYFLALLADRNGI